MSALSYPDAMSAAGAEQRKSRSAWALLWFVPLGIAVRNIDPISRAALVATVGVFGALAVFAGRDLRERVGGAVATAAMLGAGALAVWLLTPGRAALAIVAVFAILGTVLVVWAKRRTTPAARPDTSPERRAVMEARMAEGAERDWRKRAEREAEHERTAEQRRAEGAARREAEAADARRLRQVRDALRGAGCG